MPFADASADVTADFTRFEREFPTKLRQSVNKATRTITAEFKRAGNDAGEAFADAVTAQLGQLTTTARVEGARAGRAFAGAAEQFTSGINIGFDTANVQGAQIGQQFRQAVTRFTQAIPVSFTANPNARTVGVVTGQRFRAGAIAGMGQIPVDFNISEAATQGLAAGRTFRTAASQSTSNIPVGFRSGGIGGTRGGGGDSGGIFSFLNNLSLKMKLIIALSPVLISALSGATSIIAGFIGSLLPLGGLLAAIPAGFALLITSISVIALSAQRLGEVIKSSLNPAFQSLKEQVASTAVAGLDRELQAVARTISGPVRQGAVEAAAGLNVLLTETTRFFGLASTGESIRQLFLSTGVIFRQLGDASPAVLRGLLSIADAVLPAFEALGASFSRLLITFGNFLTRSAEGGQALEWVNRALATLKDLFDIVVNVGSALGAIFRAAASVSGDLVDALATLTGTFARFLTSAEGMAALEGIFKALTIVALPFVGVIEALLPALVPIGNAISQILQAVSPLTTVFAQLVTSLALGLEPIITSLMPLLTGLAQGLADLLGPLAPVIIQLGQAIGAALLPVAQQLGDVFRQLGPSLAPLIVALVQALLPAITETGPKLVSLVDAFLPLLPAIIDLVPALVQLVVALSPLLVILAQLTTIAVQLITPFLKFSSEVVALASSRILVPVIEALARAFEFIAPALNSAIGPLRSFSDLLSRFNLRDFLESLGTGIGTGLVKLGDKIAGFVTQATGFFRSLPETILDFVASLPGRLADIFTATFQAVIEAIGFGIGLAINLAITFPERFVNAVFALRERLVTFFSQLWESVTQTIFQFTVDFIVFLKSLPEQIPIVLEALGNLIINFFSNLWTTITDTTRQGAENIVAFVRSIPERLVDFISSFRDVGSRIIAGLMDGLFAFGGKAADFVSKIVAGLKGFLNDNVIGPLERGLNKGLGGVLNLKLPRLAKGALISQPTIAQLGEKGPEVVIPLTDPSRAQQLVDESGLSGIVNMDRRSVINVNVKIGETELREIVQFETDQALTEQGDSLRAGPRWVGA